MLYGLDFGEGGTDEKTGGGDGSGSVVIRSDKNEQDQE